MHCGSWISRAGAPRWTASIALLLCASVSGAAEPDSKVVSPPAAPLAARSEASGHVLAVQSTDLILDLSEAEGVTPGTRVELWRPIRLKHPVTGRFLVD